MIQIPKKERIQKTGNNEVRDNTKRSKKSTAGVGFRGDPSSGKDSKRTQESFEQENTSEFASEHAYFHPEVKLEDGKIIIPGCLSLVLLNLSRNNISEDILKYVLNVLEYQSAEVGKNPKVYRSTPGLLKLCLQRNKFDENHENHLQILKTLAKRYPIYDETANV